MKEYQNWKLKIKTSIHQCCISTARLYQRKHKETTYTYVGLLYGSYYFKVYGINKIIIFSDNYYNYNYYH